MEDREQQITNLQRIFGAAALSPVFKHNPRHNTDGVPRIAYNDIMGNNYIIKADHDFPGSGSFWTSEDTTIIAQYDSIEELVDDGWRLD